jgi:putative tryptophan/tyrosine transport system substrate-binding protein
MLAGGLLSASLAAEAQQLAKVPRIGILWTDSPGDSALRVEAFRQGLLEWGYVEGRTIAIETRWAEGMEAWISVLAGELIGLKVDLIVAGSTPAVLVAKKGSQTIPIVFATAGDPVGSGLVPSIARPGGNVTGLSLLAPELVARQLQLLKEAVPRASRVAVPAVLARADEIIE